MEIKAMCIKNVVMEDHCDDERTAFLKGSIYIFEREYSRSYFATNEFGRNHEITNDEFFNEYFIQPVDLSKVKVGEKYIIGWIKQESCDSHMYDSNGRVIQEENGDTRKYKSGDVVIIVKDGDDLCFSLKPFEDYSHLLEDLIVWESVILYPYTEPSQPLQEDLSSSDNLTPDNEEVSTEDEYTPVEVTYSNIEYARRCYNGYLRVAKVFNKELDTFVHILNEDDRMDLLEKSLWWVDGAIQDKICSILGIDINRDVEYIVCNVFNESFEDMEEFDVIIGRLRLEGVIK